MDNLFIIENDAWDAAGREEVAATCDALREVGLYRIPYRTVVARVRLDRAVGVRFSWGPDKKDRALKFVEVTLRDDDSVSPLRIVQNNGKIEAIPDPLDFEMESRETRERYHVLVPHEKVAQYIKDTLIALLATKNIEKRTSENALGRLGIGKNKKYSVITRISIGAIVDDAEASPANGTMHLRPHLRSGHIRNQRHGPLRSLIRQIFIEPVFVNADHSYVPREAYVVAGSKMKH